MSITCKTCIQKNAKVFDLVHSLDRSPFTREEEEVKGEEHLNDKVELDKAKRGRQLSNAMKRRVHCVGFR